MVAYALIDTHAHLDLMDDPEKEAVRARQAGVNRIIAVSMDRMSCEKTLELSQRQPGLILPACGLHPWNIRQGEVEQCIEFIERHADHVVAIGEIGLDYRIRTPKLLQKDVLERQLAIAKSHHRAVLLHCRLSHARVFAMVRDAGIERAVFHWYAGPIDVLKDIVDQGYVISATPAVRYSPAHRAAVLCAPLEHLVLETDAPVEYQGVASTPADVVEVCRQVALLKGLSFERVASATTKNVETLLGTHILLTKNDPLPLEC